jgi:hypothetical protein
MEGPAGAGQGWRSHGRRSGGVGRGGVEVVAVVGPDPAKEPSPSGVEPFRRPVAACPPAPEQNPAAAAGGGGQRPCSPPALLVSVCPPVGDGTGALPVASREW